MAEDVIDGERIARTRTRISVSVDKELICKRIKNFYDKDNEERSGEVEARLQRYAKFRMWTEGKDWPWQDSSDAAIPDMATASMRLQDTLHNAVMSQRPPIMAKATQERPDNQEREEKINHLLDFQFFEEQQGEVVIGQLAEDFVNEGFFTCYTPWIRETRYVEETKVYPPISPEIPPTEYFLDLLSGLFPRGTQFMPTKDGWDWKITVPAVESGEKDKRARASFFTKPNGEVEMDVGRESVVFDGPRAIRKNWQDILHPTRCENLQIKGPSNPTGAAHVIMRDYPGIDEIRRLVESGYYDLITEEEEKKLGVAKMDTSNQESEEQKDVMAGKSDSQAKPEGAQSHETLTRLTVYDCYDINGDGLDEDVMFWYIVETDTLLRAKYLGQMFPMNPPRRPFAEAGLFTVNGRREAIGVLELMEGLHDLLKMSIDQGVDAGTMANAPIGFIRSSSNVRPEVIRMAPGELYPVNDPRNDINFPVMGNQNQSFMFNMATMLNQMEERLTNIGDLQLGRVPQGKASALRTVGGMQTVLSQGDARPERVLRRFFLGLTQIWDNFHALNEIFLPEEKKFILCGPIDPRKNPYGSVKKSDVRGKYRFTFSQNALNTSKEALQTALQTLMTAYVNPLAIQMGILKPDGFYRLERDYGRAWGLDPDKYLSPPTPGAMEPPISFEDAVLMIMDGVLPRGSPMEGAQQHFQRLQEFSQSDDFAYLEQHSLPLFRAYMEQVMQLVAQEQAAMAMAQAASQFGQDMSRPGKPGPAGNPEMPSGNPAVQGGELLDETLPSAGGGANP